MAKIYQFPQGEERAKFRKEIARERKKRFAVKTGSTFVKWLGWGLNRPGFPGEYFTCELRLPAHHFRWKHNTLFLLL
ncbi:hypothetical protein KVP97_21560, partial [Escherichia coli]|nr:hypothetical protein [Escherichia coli]